MSAPEIGSIWAGGGMTVRIVDIWDDGVTVVRLTGRGRVLKRPSGRAFMPLRAFEQMRPSTLAARSPSRTEKGGDLTCLL